VETKPVPVTVSVNPAFPCGINVGLRLATVGRGLFTAKSMLAEVPPPGAGLLTVTLFNAAVAISAAVNEIWSWLEETNVVVRATPLNCTTELLIKLLPFTLSVKPCPPTMTELGLTEVTVGAGFCTAGGGGGGVPPPPPHPVRQVRTTTENKILEECNRDCASLPMTEVS
jgi:hypothetical protein